MKSYSILITGCSSGLGVELSKKFEANGHKIFRHNGRAHHDLTSIKGIEKLCIEAKKFGVNAIINNAAIVCPSIKFEDYDYSLINNMIDVNLRAPILIINNLFPNLERIININSMVGLEVKAPRTLYSATKWGLRGFSNSLKAENNNLSILDVYPTNIKTTPDRENAMDIDMVVEKIYQSFLKCNKELILDGRKK